MKNGGKLFAAAGLAAAATILAFSIGGSGPTRHVDGAGPLSSVAAGTTMAFPAGAAGPWSLGIPLCVVGTDGPAVIELVDPGLSLGSGSRFLGALVRTFVRSASDTMIISIEGYPPPSVSDHLDPAAGASVIATCATSDEPTTPFTELLIGFSVDGDSGGGWDGVDVAYHLGANHYILHVTETIVRCGAGLAPGICSTPPLAATNPPARAPAAEAAPRGAATNRGAAFALLVEGRPD